MPAWARRIRRSSGLRKLTRRTRMASFSSKLNRDLTACARTRDSTICCDACALRRKWNERLDLRSTKGSRRSGKMAPNPSARYVQDGVGIFGVLLQSLDRFDRRQGEQFDPAAQGLALHLVHHRQSAVCPRADDQPAAFPRNLLFDGKRRVTEFVPEFF